MALTMISSSKKYIDVIDPPATIALVQGSIPPVEIFDFYINSSLGTLWFCTDPGTVSGDGTQQSNIIWKQIVSLIDSGVVSLALGTATVLTSKVTLSSKITLSAAGPGGTVGNWKVSAIVPGVSFTIVSSSALDTSKVAWTIS